MLEVVSNDGAKEVHLLRIDSNGITIQDIDTESNILFEDFEDEFPNFQRAVLSASTTIDVLVNLEMLNSNYIWAHVRGKL